VYSTVAVIFRSLSIQVCFRLSVFATKSRGKMLRRGGLRLLFWSNYETTKVCLAAAENAMYDCTSSETAVDGAAVNCKRSLRSLSRKAFSVDAQNEYYFCTYLSFGHFFVYLWRHLPVGGNRQSVPTESSLTKCRCNTVTYIVVQAVNCAIVRRHMIT
jgi:hypothetical protein